MDVKTMQIMHKFDRFTRNSNVKSYGVKFQKSKHLIKKSYDLHPIILRTTFTQQKIFPPIWSLIHSECDIRSENNIPKLRFCVPPSLLETALQSVSQQLSQRLYHTLLSFSLSFFFSCSCHNWFKFKLIAFSSYILGVIRHWKSLN